MGRELRRKQAKKEGKPLTNFETKNTNEYNDKDTDVLSYILFW